MTNFSFSHNVFKSCLADIYFVCKCFNPFPNDKILDETKLKACADDKLNNKNDIYICDGVENIVGKGENAGYQHFLLFPLCFQKACIPEALKGVVVWEWVKFETVF